ncbi:MAG: 4-hydroxybenzoate octaprenyltransferase [Alphaproteobacteria bacterium]|nr:4-hydroxybenzoate octaprenyltransferase [Alphaproteobacteria bacterium]
MMRDINIWLRLLRLHRPAGIWLLLLPPLWALMLLSPAWPSLKLIGIFCLGAVITRSAGCLINDLLDRRFDAQVARTRDRPLAAGQIQARQACGLLALLMLGGLGPLLQLSYLSILIGLLAAPLIGLYPLAKRWLPLPQAWLAVVFNLGVLMAGAEVEGQISVSCWRLYLMALCWTLAYDTIYACCDLADDQRLGLHSSARLLGRWVKPFIGLCYGLMALSWTMTIVALDGQGNENRWLLLILGLISIACLVIEVIRLRLAEPATCLRHFNRVEPMGGLAILLAIMLAKLMTIGTVASVYRAVGWPG